MLAALVLVVATVTGYVRGKYDEHLQFVTIMPELAADLGRRVPDEWFVDCIPHEQVSDYTKMLGLRADEIEVVRTLVAGAGSRSWRGKR